MIVQNGFSIAARTYVIRNHDKWCMFWLADQEDQNRGVKSTPYAAHNASAEPIGSQRKRKYNKSANATGKRSNKTTKKGN